MYSVIDNFIDYSNPMFQYCLLYTSTGGLFLQKTTHDFDYINYVIGCQPTEVASMGSKQVFKGNKPAGLKCRDCAEYLTCTDSPYVLENFCDDSARGSRCCFAVDTGNHDSASCLVRYEMCIRDRGFISRILLSEKTNSIPHIHP